MTIRTTCHGALVDGTSVEEEGNNKKEECVVGNDGLCLSTSMAEAVGQDHHTMNENKVHKINDNNNDKATVECVNRHEECDYWAKTLDPSECGENPNFMLRNCVKACGMCEKTLQELDTLIEDILEEIKEEQQERELREKHFGIEQIIHTTKGTKHFQNMTQYMQTVVMVEAKYKEVRELCFNKHEQCVEWAAEGECEANPSYMTSHCAAACYQCHLTIYEERCPFDITNTTGDLWKAGQNELNKMFERIVTQHTTTATTTMDEDEEDETNKDRPVVSVLSQPPDGPWVVTIDNFLTHEESDRLIELGQSRGYEKSKDVGERQPDGTYSDYDSPDRTSTNTWCLDDCYDDPITKSVLTKIENITGIPDSYSEYLQLLNYQVGQFYGQHHDYIEHLKERQEGPRIITVFLYLNDVEAGGGTNFPLLKNNITVMPKRGTCLIWPSVLNEFPNDKDDRTDHQALPVEKGVKYGANAWLHNRDFKTPYKTGCA